MADDAQSLVHYVRNSSADPNLLVADLEIIFASTVHNAEAYYYRYQHGNPLGQIATLYGDGCATSDGTLNCTEVCSNTTLIFKTWQSQWSCLVLASLAIGSTSFNISQSWIDTTNKVTAELAVPDLAKFDGAAVLNATYHCARASCTNDESFGPCSAEKIFGSQAPSTGAGLLTTLVDDIDNLCATVPKKQLDPDIGGPGVRLSYMLQGVLALYCLVISRLFTASTTIKWLKTTLESSNEALNPRLKSILSRIEESKIADATTNLLVEFQEAQSFFVLAIQIALLYATLQGISFINATSMSGYIANQQWIRESALFVLFPVILTQINLRRMGRDSIYSYLLCIVIMALGAAAVETVVLSYQQDALWALFAGQFPVEECGGNSSLRAYCTHGTTFVVASSDSLPFVLALYGVLLLEKLSIVLSSARWYSGLGSKLSVTQAKVIKSMKSAMSFILALFYASSEIALVALIGKSFSTIYGTATEGWNIGQLIAALIWAPVLAKYIYQITLGVTDTFESRIPDKYAVVKKPDQQQVTSPEPGSSQPNSIAKDRPIQVDYSSVSTEEPDGVLLAGRATR